MRAPTRQPGMHIVLNGQPTDLPATLTVEGLVVHLGLTGQRLAVDGGYAI